MQARARWTSSRVRSVRSLECRSVRQRTEAKTEQCVSATNESVVKINCELQQPCMNLFNIVMDILSGPHTHLHRACVHDCPLRLSDEAYVKVVSVLYVA